VRLNEADDRSGIVFPFTHIGGITWLFTMLITGCTGVFIEAFAPPTTIPISSSTARAGLTNHQTRPSAMIAGRRTSLKACPPQPGPGPGFIAPAGPVK